MHDSLIQFVVFLTAAVVAVPLFRFFKMGAILAYLFAGIIIGPSVLSMVTDTETILHFSELGVVFLLFLIGLELQPRRLWEMRNHVFGMGLLQIVVTGLLFMGIGVSFGLSNSLAFLAGFGLALSSTAFGLQILEEKRQMRTIHGQGSFSILLMQDLAVVPLIAMVPILAGQSTGQVTLLGVLKSLGIVVAFIVVGLYLIRYIFSFIARSRVVEVFTAASLLVVVGSALLMESAGLSMGTGAFLGGMLLANSEYRHELESNLHPFKGLLLGLFFMAVGMSLNLDAIFAQPMTVVGLVFGFMGIKALVIFTLARFFKFPYESSRNMAFTLPQGGEFAFVLFAAAGTAGLLASDLSAILSAAVTISMALTPLFFNLNQKYLRTFSEISERPYDNITSEGAQVIIAGYGRFGQIVSRMLKSQGISFTILEHSAAQVDTARKFGSKVFYGDASRKDIMESAGGKDAKLLVLAIDDPVTSVETAKMAKEAFPNLKIIARVRNRQHAIELLALGIEQVHRETYLTSLEVAKEVLMDLGHERSKINVKLATFRTHDEQILRKQFELQSDEAQMMKYTKESNEELEEILRGDLEISSGDRSSKDQPPVHSNV